MDANHAIATLGGVAVGIILCKLLTKEGFQDVWDGPAPVDDVTGTVGPDTGPTIIPQNIPPTTYPADQADFLLMNDVFDMATATPVHPIPPFVTTASGW